MFTHCDDFHSKFKELTRSNLNEVRMYDIGEGVKLPSITSIISFVNREKFADWRARVGNEAANKKAKHATRRGTDLHLVFEYYLADNRLCKLYLH